VAPDSHRVGAAGIARVGRRATELRPVRLERGAVPYAEGSCLISFGNTRVLCAASVEEGVPGWKRGSGEGWLTAEYAMLPRATLTRTSRERGSASVGGRTHEIQRLIGRSVRAMLDGFAFGEFTVRVDCDVVQADGGTRTAAITGACVAVSDAFSWMALSGRIETTPVKRRVAAVSVGIVGGEARLDLEYTEDSRADVDMNVVMVSPPEGPGGGNSGDRQFVEVQGTGERQTFDRAELDALLELATVGIRELDAAQRAALAGPLPGAGGGGAHATSGAR
jgi:ribonuclease PH